MKTKTAFIICLIGLASLATLAHSHETENEDVKRVKDKKEEDKKKPLIKPVVEEEHKPSHQHHERPVFQIPSIPSFPIFPQIHFPQIHFPAIPLPQFPEFPSLPSLPRPFKRETIRATKTLFVETTKKVTRHPVCVTALPGKLRPCLFNKHSYNRDGNLENEELSATGEKDQIQPTAVAAPILETRILSAITHSEPIEDEVAADSLAASLESESNNDSTTGRRQGRYIVRHPIKKMSQVAPTEPLNSVPVDLRIDALEEGDGHFKPGILKATHYITKTLWVTKIEDVIDHRVTATLLAKNCIPSESIIPRCGKWKDETPAEAEKTAESETAESF